MKYKIVSSDSKLIQKAQSSFHAANFKEAIHIQDVVFWLVDANTLDEQAIESYQNRMKNTFILFVTHNISQIQQSLRAGFTHYMTASFEHKELMAWIHHALERNQASTCFINEQEYIDFKQGEFHLLGGVVSLTQQERRLLSYLNQEVFIATQQLAHHLKMQSTTSVRTLINRIRKKSFPDLIEQKKGIGYRLNVEPPIQKPELMNDAYIHELQEQNRLIQKIVDNSSIFVVTFVHKQLYCINASFRVYLGKEIIKELWDEAKGDFFELLDGNASQIVRLKEELFEKMNTQIVRFHPFNNKALHFSVQSYYFKALDKHLFIFTPKS